MKNILVLGATGLFGPILCDLMEDKGFRATRQSRQQLFTTIKSDPLDNSKLLDLMKSTLPDTVINLIASTDVEQCEINPSLAIDANIRTIENVVWAIGRSGAAIHLVHLSTDQVYSGTGPHFERDARPKNVYALSKFVGEAIAKRTRATVIRTNFFGRSRTAGRISLTDWAYANFTSGVPFIGFGDVVFNPLSMQTLAELISHIVVTKPQGVFNLGTNDYRSKAALILEFAERLNLDKNLLTVGSSENFGFKAYRPHDMRLRISKAQRKLKIRFPSMSEEIERVAFEYTYNKVKSKPLSDDVNRILMPRISQKGG